MLINSIIGPEILPSFFCVIDLVILKVAGMGGGIWQSIEKSEHFIAQQFILDIKVRPGAKKSDKFGMSSRTAYLKNVRSSQCHHSSIKIG